MGRSVDLRDRGPGGSSWSQVGGGQSLVGVFFGRRRRGLRTGLRRGLRGDLRFVFRGDLRLVFRGGFRLVFRGGLRFVFRAVLVVGLGLLDDLGLARFARRPEGRRPSWALAAAPASARRRSGLEPASAQARPGAKTVVWTAPSVVAGTTGGDRGPAPERVGPAVPARVARAVPARGSSDADGAAGSLPDSSQSASAAASDKHSDREHQARRGRDARRRTSRGRLADRGGALQALGLAASVTRHPATGRVRFEGHCVGPGTASSCRVTAPRPSPGFREGRAQCCCSPRAQPHRRSPARRDRSCEHRGRTSSRASDRARWAAGAGRRPALRWRDRRRSDARTRRRGSGR
jgi:hypothetical protein